MFICKNVVDFMESIAPVREAEHWDNVGLLLGSLDKKVENMLLCLDVTTSVVSEALDKKVDMIISHHPIIFKELNRVLENEGKGKILYRLIKGDICVYSAHTNLDVAMEGVNKKLAEKLEIDNIKSLKGREQFYIKESYFGLGAIGELKVPMEFEDFIKHVKKKLNVMHVRTNMNVCKLIKKVAVFCGSFDDDIDIVIENNADVLVTGDLKYHTAMEALERNLCIIDAGHFNTENIIVPHLKNILDKEFPSLCVMCNNIESDPFKTY